MKKDTCVSKNGRVNSSGNFIEKGSIYGTISTASQHEIDKWKKTDHPITHQIICQGSGKAVAGDYLQYNSRNFYIQGKENPGEIDHFTIYFCEERNDVY